MNAASRQPGRLRLRALLALAVGLGAAALTTSHLPAVLDDAWLAWIAARHDPPARTPVLVMGIDDASLQALGPWPWPRDRIATALERLQAAGARAVALDLPLERADAAAPEADARLARRLPGSRTVLGMALEEDGRGGLRARLPAPEFAEATHLGHVLLEQDSDGRVRLHRPLSTSADGLHWPSLAAALHGVGGSPPLPTEEPWRIPALTGAAGPGYHSFADLAGGRIAETELRGRWILLGLAAPALVQAVPGPQGSGRLFPVQHQALALAAWLQGAAARPLAMPFQATLAFVLAAGAALGGMGGLGHGRGGRMPAAFAIGVLATLGLSAVLLFRQWWFAPSGTVLALAGMLVLWLLARLRRRLRARRRLPGLVGPGRLRRAVAAAPTHVLLTIELADAGEGHAPAELHQVATLLRQRARRPGDLVARTGPGRFAVLLPDTGIETAARLLEELCEDARGAGLPLQAQVHACGHGGCRCAEWLA